MNGRSENFHRKQASVSARQSRCVRAAKCFAVLAAYAAAMCFLLPQELDAQLTSSWEVAERESGARGHEQGRTIAGPDGTHFVVIGEHSLRRTSDGGASWTTLRETSPGREWSAVAHPAPSTIFLLENKAPRPELLRSDDGGASWTGRPLPTRSYDIHMCDSEHGLIFSRLLAPSRILATDDGWTSWREIALPPGSYEAGITQVHCIAPDVFAINGRNISSDPVAMELHLSVDGGASWETIHSRSAADGILRYFFLNPSEIWAAGSAPTYLGAQARDLIIRSRDGGQNWETLLDELIEPNTGLSAIAFADSRNGIAAGYEGKILRSRDGGLNWEKELRPVALPPYSTSRFVQALHPEPDVTLLVHELDFLLRTNGRQTLQAPEFIQPGPNQSITPGEDVLIEWTAVVGATGYHLLISEQVSSLFYDVEAFDRELLVDSELAETGFVMSGLKYNRKYVARVRALNDDLASEWRERVLFVTETSTEQDFLQAPLVTFPADLSANVPIDVELTIDSTPDAFAHDVELSTDPTFVVKNAKVLRVANTTATVFSLTGLEWNTLYFTRTRGRFDIGVGPWSFDYGQVHSFRTSSSASTSVAADGTEAKLRLAVRPNPLRDYAYIRLPAELSTARARLAVHDALGRPVLDLSDDLAQGMLRFDASQLPAGRYFLRYQSGTVFLTHSIVVLR